MKLIDAPGGPEIQAALRNEHVQKIVDILLQIKEIDKDFFDTIADFLQRCDGETPTKKVARKLQVLREYSFKRVDVNGQRVLSTFSSSAFDELFQSLEALYDAEKRVINYRRGAIVELLIYKMINARCQHGECWSNQCLDDQLGRYRSQQVDVIALLEKKYQIEGYSCKINIYSMKHAELTDIFYLSVEAKRLNYATHAGVVSFDHSSVIRQRLENLSVPDNPYMSVLYFPEEIAAYGLDNISDLVESPFVANI